MGRGNPRLGLGVVKLIILFVNFKVFSIKFCLILDFITEISFSTVGKNSDVREHSKETYESMTEQMEEKREEPGKRQSLFCLLLSMSFSMLIE